MILYGNDRQEHRPCSAHHPAAAGTAPAPGAQLARRRRLDLGVGGGAGTALREGGVPVQFGRAARALYICGLAEGRRPHPDGVRPGGCRRSRAAGAAASAQVRANMEEISAINIELLSRGELDLNEHSWRKPSPSSPTWRLPRWRPPMRGTEKVTSSHLERIALVYLRQSSMAQVRENTESTARQYALVEEAVRLGWPAGQGGGDRRRPRPLGPLCRAP